MVSVDDGSLRGGGSKLKTTIWAHAKKVLLTIKDHDEVYNHVSHFHFFFKNADYI